MNEQSSEEFNINEDDVATHAPIVYNAIQEHYGRIDRLISALSDSMSVRQRIESNTNFFGILPSKEIKYDESFLKNDDFRVSVIYHLCFSNIMGCLLSWESYLFLSKIVHLSFFEISKEMMSVDSMMLKFFKVSPAALPRNYLFKTLRVDEFNKAVELIVGELKEVDPYDPDKFPDYEDYFEYMKEKAGAITIKCNNHDFWGTHKIERFACACIASKMKLPIIDPLYDIPEASNPVKIGINSIKSMQRKILDKMFEDEDDDEEGEEYE